ncbi:hypothetical protein AGMMS49992_19340 [Clostridia bacterium]|nr:hypothetical protein AGMMS49992_19340 [Clostridia bacterium]
MKIAYGNSRLSRKWSNKEITFEELCGRVATPIRTSETMVEYARMPKAQRDNVKDVGGYVVGHLRGGQRKKTNVECRSAITLDADFADTGFLQRVSDAGHIALIYSTHGHIPDAPRFRLILPLSRDITADEYSCVARMVAHDIGMDAFDDSTYEPSRLMYWPSTPQDGEYICETIDGAAVDPDTCLQRLTDWTDCTLWPTSTRQSSVIEHNARSQADPLAKEGVVGAFCRAYSVEDAIAEFLLNVYTPAVISGRYTYLPGSTSAGVAIYGDGRWAYSHHGTDPAAGMLLNAFDLVRVHKFPGLDDKEGYKAMCSLAVQNDRVKEQLSEERLAEAAREFAPNEKWTKALEYDKSGKLKDTLDNLILILQHDPNLSDIRYNVLRRGIDFTGEPPWDPVLYPTWAENDFAQLLAYISARYGGLYSPSKTTYALDAVIARRKYHPVREYLQALPPWDGVPRVDTLLVDYLAAENTDYVHAVTRKTLCAAVARAFVPGIKFDHVLVMNGPQDKGKSTLFNRLAGDDFYNDGLTLTDMQTKAASENLQGYWIMEIGELTGMRKSDVDAVKSFISRRDDKYRPSYGRVVENHPRQCIIVATVNGPGGFLRDITGNRRFWPVSTPGDAARKPWELADEEVAQIWAETLLYWQNGEKLFLEGDLREAAQREQNAAIEMDPREGAIAEYLEMLLPEKWYVMDIYQRRDYLRGGKLNPVGVMKRDFVSTTEVWAECLEKDVTSIKKMDGYEVGLILRRLGWDQTEERKRIPGYGQQRIWRRMSW